MNKISNATIGKVEENGFADHLTCTIEEEEVDLSDDQHYRDAKYLIDCFIGAVDDETHPFIAG